MNPRSKIPSIALVAFFLATGGAFASMDSDLFKAVPPGDATYDKLQKLEDAGFLPADSSKKVLTRYEVAELIWKAQKNYGEIVVAAAGDMEMPPSAPSESSNYTAAAPAAKTALPPAAPSGGNDYSILLPPSDTEMSDKTAASSEALPAAPTPKPTPNYNLHPELLKDAEDNLKSLDETYELELQVIQQDKNIVLDDLAKAESTQYDLWRQVKNLDESPHLSVHGIGRMFGVSQQYFGSYIGNPFMLFTPKDFQPTRRTLSGYVDLKAEMAVSKQIQWEAIWRFTTSNLPSAQASVDSSNPLDGYYFRRLAVEFSPDFMSSTLGDFYQAYTPLTLWNRNNLDIFYKPEPVQRWDDTRKYDNYYNNEPAWPLRGIRIGTALGWPDSEVIDRFKISGFAHLLNLLSGTKVGSTASVIGAANASPQFTEFLAGVQAEIKTKKLWTDDIAWQFTLDGYEIVLDKVPDVPAANTQYDPVTVTSWLNQYRITSVCPELKAGFNGDIYVGIQSEWAVASYQADKFNSGRTTIDFASMIRPFFNIEESKIAFNILTVYPYYYSPMAQLRQDYPGSHTSYAPGADLFTTPLNDQFLLLASVRRAERLYGFYDRTQDNVFPYGLATPNRQGFGLDADIKSVPDKALKVGVSAYILSEISGNLVMDGFGPGFVGVDATSTGVIPIRNFVYINVGPSYDFGSLIGLKTPLELGFNFRDEETNSQVGHLSSSWIMGGAKVGLFSWWDVTAAAGNRTMVGTEMGINGSVFGRYSYIYNNEDLGHYSPFTVNGSIQNWLLSSTFRLDEHSKLNFDYSMTWGKNAPNYGSILGPASSLAAELNNQYMEMTYEVKF